MPMFAGWQQKRPGQRWDKCPTRRAPVLGADTTVVVDRHILGKPADREAAATMLRRLSGGDHEVLTAVAIVDGEGAEKRDSRCRQPYGSHLPVH